MNYGFVPTYKQQKKRVRSQAMGVQFTMVIMDIAMTVTSLPKVGLRRHALCGTSPSKWSGASGLGFWSEQFHHGFHHFCPEWEWSLGIFKHGLIKSSIFHFFQLFCALHVSHHQSLGPGAQRYDWSKRKIWPLFRHCGLEPGTLFQWWKIPLAPAD